MGVDYAGGFPEFVEIKKTIKYNINDIIALCDDLDDFWNFHKNCVEFIKSDKSNITVLESLCKNNFVMSFNYKFTSDFYKKNYNFIKKFNKYSDIIEFILNYYTDSDKTFDLMSIYSYLERNRNNIVKIIIVLRQLQNLGFNTFKFNENIDFNDKTYYYENGSKSFYYLNGEIKVIPTLYKGVKYKSINANYEMMVILNCGGYYISSYDHSIVLNSLVFNANELPKELSFEETIDKIIDLKKDNENAEKFIETSANFDIVLSIIGDSINRLDSVIEQIDYNKNDVDKLSNSLKETINELKDFLSNYENKKIVENPNITREILDKEKSLLRSDCK